MAIMNTSITVKVPATTANLGPGFDCLGMALDFRNAMTEEARRYRVNSYDDRPGVGRGGSRTGPTGRPMGYHDHPRYR